MNGWWSAALVFCACGGESETADASTARDSGALDAARGDGGAFDAGRGDTGTGDEFAIARAAIEAGALRITGSGFGERTRPGPLHFETFDARAVGSAPETFGYHGYGGFGGSVAVDDAEAFSGARALRHRTGAPAPDDAGIRESFPHIALRGMDSTELYLTYRLRFSTHGVGRIRQLKFNRGGGEIADAPGSPCYGGRPKFFESYYPVDGTSTTDRTLAFVQGGIVRADQSIYEGWIGESFGTAPPAEIPENLWVQVEAYYRLNDVGEANGEYVTHVRGHRNFDLHELAIRDDASELLECSYLVIGIDFHLDEEDPDGLSIWYDDHWLDTSRARVVLADANDFDVATMRSPQPATAWSAGAIEAQLHTAGFESGANAWVFVVRADGAVSEGAPITIP